MPQGCGTWPAVWELGPDWPQDGEVDIVEGVNDVVPNQSTLHTSPGCTMPSGITQTGTQVSTDCNTAGTFVLSRQVTFCADEEGMLQPVNGNQGCAVHTTDANSYGPAFNTVRVSLRLHFTHLSPTPTTGRMEVESMQWKGQTTS